MEHVSEIVKWFLSRESMSLPRLQKRCFEAQVWYYQKFEKNFFWRNVFSQKIRYPFQNLRKDMGNGIHTIFAGMLARCI